MGKQKRARQKYHLACVNGRIENNDTRSESGRSSVSMKSSGKLNPSISSDLFKNIDIDVDNLKKLSNPDEDRKSVLSISKTIKRSIAESGSNVHLKKKDKRGLKHDLFLKKIEAIHELLKKNKKSKKGRKNEPSEVNLDELPQENMLFFKSEFKRPKGPKPISQKKRPTAKAKIRKQETLKNIEAFKKIMDDQKSLNDTLGALTESIQQKLFNDEI